jgi:hypothetical protein
LLFKFQVESVFPKLRVLWTCFWKRDLSITQDLTIDLHRARCVVINDHIQ